MRKSFNKLFIPTFRTNQEDKRSASIHNNNFTNNTILTLPTSLPKNSSVDEYLSSDMALAVSGGLVILIIVLSNAKNFWFFKRTLRSSEVIHNNMFSRLLRAPLQFFNVNPSGSEKW